MDQGAPRDPLEVEDRLWEGAGGHLAYDVGANMGQSVARMVDLFDKVVAFEPAEESYSVLHDQWGGAERVRIFNLAISDHPGVLRLAVRAAPILTGQLTAVGMPYHGEGRGAPGMANWGAETGFRELGCDTLDGLVPQLGTPDFVKVDTEGHEAQVLRGAATLLAEGRPRWLVEFHSSDLHDECVRLLEDAGYEVETVRHPHYPPGTHMWPMHGWLKAAVPAGEAR